MRNLIALTLSFLAVTAFAEIPPDFERANIAYAEGRFADARDAYQEIVEREEFSADLFHNLGNAWHRLENPGQAVLAYHRALALDPTHTGARANLERIQATTGARVPAEPVWMQYYPTLGADTYVWIATIAGWGMIFTLAARLLGLMRRRFAYSAAALGFVIGLLCVPVLQRQIKNEKAAVVISAETMARSAPTSSAATADKLPAGSVVRLLALRGDWAYAEMPDAQNLWIPSADLAPVRL